MCTASMPESNTNGLGSVPMGHCFCLELDEIDVFAVCWHSSWQPGLLRSQNHPYSCTYRILRFFWLVSPNVAEFFLQISSTSFYTT